MTFEPKWGWGLIALLLVVGYNCQKQHRRTDDSSDVGQPASRVEPQGDPRFPAASNTEDRSGLWVEQSVKTGSVSPTELANTVADELPDVEQQCCSSDDACRGLEGRLSLALTLDGRGKVQHVEIAETSVYRRAFQTCLTDRAATWRLAEPASNSTEKLIVPIRIRFTDTDSGEPD